METFDEAVHGYMPKGLKCDRIEQIQVNIGRRCNLYCRHCHLECAPDRSEIMKWSTMESILEIATEISVDQVDITGGSPELHPHFRRFLTSLCNRNIPAQVRTNFAVLVEPDMEGDMEFMKDHRIRIVGSLPCYLEENVRAQRGVDVYDKSIRAIRHLNDLGYGMEADLQLNLVYNPGGPFLPGSQAELENTYKKELGDRFGIRFHRLLVITNMPIGRFKRRLESERAESRYMDELVGAFNPDTLKGLMCRRQISVDWDGRLYDCDFNIALNMPVNHGAPDHIRLFDGEKLSNRQVVTGAHCFGCTAGAGSSCAGALA